MQEMIQMGSPNQYNEYYNWLDEYNADETQPSEQPTVFELRQQFPGLGEFEALQIIVNWMEQKEKQLKGG